MFKQQTSSDSSFFDLLCCECSILSYNGKHRKQKKTGKSYICLNLLPNNHLPNVATSTSKRLVGSFEWIVAIGLSGSCDCWVHWVESHLNSLGKESAQLVWLSSRLSSFQGLSFQTPPWLLNVTAKMLLMKWQNGKVAKHLDDRLSHRHNKKKEWSSLEHMYTSFIFPPKLCDF